MKSRRAVLIGLDGVPFGLIRDLCNRGVMPNCARLLPTGSFLPMASSIPDVSSVAWSSVLTGANPGEHGIFGFMELDADYSFRFPQLRDLRAAPIWDTLNKRGMKAAILNVPSTYPARRLDGVLVSGFVAIDLDKAVWPGSLVPELRRTDYRIDVDSDLGHGDMCAFLKDLRATLDSRMRLFRHVWGMEDWGLFMFVFTGTDRLHHFLYGAWEDKGHPRHQAFLDYYAAVDRGIGEIVANVKDDDLLIIHSDHGFGRLDREIYTNNVLKEFGFLSYTSTPPKSYADLSSETKAFALDPARIYVHRKGRYVRGCVEAADVPRVVDDVVAALTKVKIDGVAPVGRICRNEEIFSGPEAERGPDLVILGSDGCDWKARPSASGLSGRGIFTGRHTHPDAFLFVRGDQAALPSSPTVCDVKPILMAHLGA